MLADPLDLWMGAGASCLLQEETKRGHLVGFCRPQAVDHYFKSLKTSFIGSVEMLHESQLHSPGIERKDLLSYDDPNYKYYENYQIWELLFQAVANEADLQMLYLRHVRGLTLLEVGKLFGITRERVRQRTAKACCKMRRRVCQLGIKPDELLPV